MRILISHILPKEKALKYNQSIAAHLFCYNLINGNLFDRVYSILPSIHIDRTDLQYSDTRIQVMYSNLRNSRLGLKVAFFIEDIELMFKIPPKSTIWFYNLNILSVLLFWFLKLFRPSVSLNIILLDYTPGAKGIKFLKEKLLSFSINKADGMIQLAINKLFKVKNSMCLPGVVPNDAIFYPKVKRIVPEFLISGVLTDNIAMLTMLLEAFSSMPQVTLHITGRAPDSEIISDYTKKYKNIIYHGLVDYGEYLNILHSIPFLLSTRDPRYPENRCNFPSKIIEALLHNRIIVSTLHYPQLNGIKYYEVPADLSGFKAKLLEIVNIPYDIQITYANQAEDVRRRFNTKVWNESMTKIENKEL